ncbi:MAG TPA: EF-hand domain-containing protein [Gemmataceae bacterium]|nr:EF-hand domain-containing protein [Gemmataceae bacterium]
MTFTLRSAIGLLLALACVNNAPAQTSTAKPPSEEDGRLDRIIERWLEANESEREHVLRELARGNNGKPSDDYGQWFTRLGGADDGWDRTCIQRGAVRDIFDRIAQRIVLRGPVMSRSQFVAYAEQYWNKDKSPAWRAAPSFDTSAEAVRLFKRLDHNHDGYLGSNEMSPTLREDLKRWDKDRDGWITFDEYSAFFAYRLDKVYRERQQRAEKPLPELPIRVVVDEEKPAVMRVGRLPVGLPAWFAPVDTDGDGQIGLYEWRLAGWPIEEFQKLDANDDGFLEPVELLRALAIVNRDGERPFAYLLQKRVGK